MENWNSKIDTTRAQLQLSIEEYTERLDISNKCVYFDGNIEAFLFFMDLIIYSNLNQEDIDVSNLPFLTNKVNKKFFIEFIDDTEVNDGLINESGYPKLSPNIVENNDMYTWKISETQAMIIANLMHGFQYAWDHLHFDADSPTNLSVNFYLNNAKEQT